MEEHGRMPEHLRQLYILVLKHNYKVRVSEGHRDKALTLIVSSTKDYEFLNIIVGGSKGRKWRIQPK